MLSFEEKLEICSSFPGLTRKDVSLGRVNFHYEDSVYEKKTVVYHLHPNGNGFVYAAQIPGAEADDKGFVNIRDSSAEELRELIRASIRSLSGDGEAADSSEDVTGEAPDDGSEPEKQRWTGPEGHVLTLHYENELWFVYSGENLESAFETLEEAEEYLREEGFEPA